MEDHYVRGDGENLYGPTSLDLCRAFVIGFTRHGFGEYSFLSITHGLCEVDRVYAPGTKAPMAHEFAFDVKISAAIRVMATTCAEAIKMLNDGIESADGTFGVWSDGTQITGECSIYDEPSLFEIDGNPV